MVPSMAAQRQSILEAIVETSQMTLMILLGMTTPDIRTQTMTVILDPTGRKTSLPATRNVGTVDDAPTDFKLDSWRETACQPECGTHIGLMCWSYVLFVPFSTDVLKSSDRDGETAKANEARYFR